MAELSSNPRAPEQIAAIARVRWQLFLNSLRKIRGRLEAVSRILVGLWLAVIGLGGAVGLGAAAKYFVSADRPELLAIFLWIVFLFWQLFPVIASVFAESFDSSNLLRFPLSYRSYFLVRLAYGSFDPATIVGSLWLLGMTIGIGIGQPNLFLWSALVLLSFAVLNILLARMIFAWVERWLAKRRTRETMGLVFFIFMISFQFIGPLVDRFGKKPRPGILRVTEAILPLERLLPPGLASEAIGRMAHGQLAVGLGSFALLSVYGLAILWLLNLRMRAQFRGENLSEAVARVAGSPEKPSVRLGWGVPGFSGPAAAIFEKELRYLSRSGPMMFTLVMPVVVLLIFRVSPARSGRGGNPLMRTPDLAFPVGAAYALLILTNFVYNNFGAEGAGIQLFFASPVRFREVVAAKNLAHAAVVALEIALVYLGVFFMFGPPAIDVVLATLAGALFAVLVNFSVGNPLSLISPKKIDFGTFGRQRASGITQLASLGTQIGVLGLAGVTFFIARHSGRTWLATIVFLALAAAAFAVYAAVLNRVDRMALDHRENLITELSRA